jgi:hypothetical protein
VLIPTTPHRRLPFVRWLRWLRKVFQASLWLHTGAAPTLPSSVHDRSVHHIQDDLSSVAAWVAEEGSDGITVLFLSSILPI